MNYNYTMIKKFLCITVMIFYFITPLFSYNSKQVLILHSYRPNYSWNANIEKGILDKLNSSGIDVDITIEYMDILNTDKKTQNNLLFDLYYFKYSNMKFDSIITTDNDALNFMKLYRDKIWPNVPVVFCGVNWFKPEMISGLKNATGVIENITIKETLEIALKQNSDINNIIFWSLNNSFINDNLISAKKLLELEAPDINVIYEKGISLSQGLKEYKNLKSNDIVFLLSPLRDENGHIYSPSKTAQQISNMSDAPTYALHDMFLGHGIVGGYLVSGFNQGEAAAKYVVQILNGEQAENLPIIKNSPNQYMFDDTQLYRFGIPTYGVPANSILINDRPSIYTRFRLELIIISIVFIIFILFIIFRIAFKFRNQLKREKLLLHQRGALFDLSNDLLCITSSKGVFKHLNKSWTKVLGWTKEELKGEVITKFVHTDDLARTKEHLYLSLSGKAFSNFRIRYLCKDGSYIWLSWDSYPFRGQNDIFIVVRDITVEQKYNEKLEHLATFDDLTEIPNRRGILDYLNTELQRSKRYDLDLGILMIDIDHFKDFNDEYGHQTGDLILKKVSEIAGSVLRNADKIGRYGGDEFIIVLPESNRTSSLIVAERIRKSIGLAILPNDLSITISIGCTVFENDKTFEEILERADEALYKSKDSGRNHVSFI